MTLLFLTADRIGIQTGGGAVTYHESKAFFNVALDSGKSCRILDRTALSIPDAYGDEPWLWDYQALQIIKDHNFRPTLCHVYAGTFTNSVEYLKSIGCKVTYTAAAHDIKVSREEHEKLGWGFNNYPHLTVPSLWEQYVRGYMLADVLICPSTVSANTMRNFGYQGDIHVIPHGVHIPDEIAKVPEKFTVGYLGAIGPDKGLIYLLQAWKQLNYQDAELVFAGKESKNPYLTQLAAILAPATNIRFMGWVNDIKDFYNQISLYVQPSATEGFGIEVLEALAFGRPALCSVGAGASDIVPETYKFAVGDVKAITKSIEVQRDIAELNKPTWELNAHMWRSIAKTYTWEKIRSQYVALWRSML